MGRKMKIATSGSIFVLDHTSHFQWTAEYYRGIRSSQMREVQLMGS